MSVGEKMTAHKHFGWLAGKINKSDTCKRKAANEIFEFAFQDRWTPPCPGRRGVGVISQVRHPSATWNQTGPCEAQKPCQVCGNIEANKVMNLHAFLYDIISSRWFSFFVSRLDVYSLIALESHAMILYKQICVQHVCIFCDENLNNYEMVCSEAGFEISPHTQCHENRSEKVISTSAAQFVLSQRGKIVDRRYFPGNEGVHPYIVGR